MNEEPIHVLPAQYMGQAEVKDGYIKIPIGWVPRDLDVYIRRISTDGRIVELHMADHDGLYMESMAWDED